MIMTINKTSSTHNQQRKATNTMAFSVMGKHSHLEPLEAVSEGNNRRKEGEVKIYISLDSLICLAGIIILTLNLLGLSLKGITEERKRRSKKNIYQPGFPNLPCRNYLEPLEAVTEGNNKRKKK